MGAWVPRPRDPGTDAGQGSPRVLHTTGPGPERGRAPDTRLDNWVSGAGRGRGPSREPRCRGRAPSPERKELAGAHPRSRCPGLTVPGTSQGHDRGPGTGVPAIAGTHYPAWQAVLSPGETPPDPPTPGCFSPFRPVLAPFWPDLGHLGPRWDPPNSQNPGGETPRTPPLLPRE